MPRFAVNANELSTNSDGTNDREIVFEIDNNIRCKEIWAMEKWEPHRIAISFVPKHGYRPRDPSGRMTWGSTKPRMKKIGLKEVPYVVIDGELCIVNPNSMHCPTCGRDNTFE
jgi:hypothetical protein